VSGDERAVLLALADEALVLQERAEQVMEEISDEGPLDDLSARGGPLVSRFCQMRRELPACEEPLLRSAAEVLDMVFANHAMALDAALDLLAVSWRSERMAATLHRLEGLGRPATWLRTIRAELAGELEAPA
jgi:ABC-type phosphate transport system auxiliary subunit